MIAERDVAQLVETLEKREREIDALSRELKILCEENALLKQGLFGRRSERLRHVAIGRKNWLVFASERGGEVDCRLYSLVLSCKQAGVDPDAYIEDVLGRLSTTPATVIATLTPWAWAAARK